MDVDKKKKQLPYTDIIKDIYDGVVINIRTCDELINDFVVTIEFYHGSMLSPILFVKVIHELIKTIQNEISVYYLLAIFSQLLR